MFETVHIVLTVLGWDGCVQRANQLGRAKHSGLEGSRVHAEGRRFADEKCRKVFSTGAAIASCLFTSVILAKQKNTGPNSMLIVVGARAEL